MFPTMHIQLRSPHIVLVAAIAAAITWLPFVIKTARAGLLGLDFDQYWIAATRFAGGGSVYLDAYRHGPIAAQAGDYVYLPAVAQVLSPLTGLSNSVAFAIYAVIGLGIFVVTTWMCARAGGARADRRLVLGIILLMSASFPVTFAVLYGNIEAPLVAVLAIALVARPATSGAALAIGVLIKVTPFAMVPALAMRSRRGLVAFGLTLLGIGGIGFLLAPDDWLSAPSVILNLAAGKIDYRDNFAPGAMTAWYFGTLAGSVVRVLTLVVAAGLLGLSVVLARRSNGWPAALLAATFASMLVPATLWLHYPAILLPFIAFAWPHAGSRARLGIGCALTLMVAYFLFFPIALVGLLLLGASLLVALWPPRGALQMDGVTA